jgi:hypothetical protein
MNAIATKADEMLVRALEDDVQPPVAAQPGKGPFNHPADAGSPLDAAERALLRLEFFPRFGQAPSLADGIWAAHLAQRGKGGPAQDTGRGCQHARTWSAGTAAARGPGRHPRVFRPERTKHPDFSGWRTRHEHYAILSANSGGVVEASIRQYFPTLSASPATIAGQIDVLPSPRRHVSREVLGNVLSLTRSRAYKRATDWFYWKNGSHRSDFVPLQLKSGCFVRSGHPA